MRKMFAIVAVATAVALAMSGAAYAIPLSAGVGASFGTETVGLDWENNRFKVKEQGLGLSAFFDAHYVAASVDLMSGSYDLSGRIFKENGTDPETYDLEQVVSSLSATLLNFNLIGKYPLPLYGLERVSVFPMIGAGYQMAQIVQAEGPLFGSYNSIKILFGIGGDFDISERVFLRFVLLPHYALTKNSTKKIVKDHFGKPDWNAHGGFGASGHILAGFRLGHIAGSEN